MISPGADARLNAVNRILEELGFVDMPTVVALNKADAADPEVLAREVERTGGIPVSALKNRGVPELKEALADAVAQVQRQELARQEEARAARVEWR